MTFALIILLALNVYFSVSYAVRAAVHLDKQDFLIGIVPACAAGCGAYLLSIAP